MKKTDNSNLAGKLALRRQYLRRFHAGSVPAVLDCCCADQQLWTLLRAEFPCKYLGVDKEKKRNQLVMQSERLLQLPRLPYDVIDVDTYGQPWKHWRALLPNLVKPVTVFLTIGQIRFNGIGAVGSEDPWVFEAMGAKFERLKIPASFGYRIAARGVPFCLAWAYKFDLKIESVAEAPRSKNARYLAVRVTP